MITQNNPDKELLAPDLDELLNDSRLERLFSMEARPCALQLWVLQIKHNQLIENRIIYGRLLPYSHSSDSWSCSDNDKFQPFGQFKARITRLDLYVKSALCVDLLRQLSSGRTITEISEAFGLGIRDKFREKFGSAALNVDDLTYRPVAYLLNRDAHEQHSPSSPHSGAGAFSASITQTDKGALFHLDQVYNVTLAASAVKHLSEDTGLDFGGVDTPRLGDLELLVFPTLDDLERPLLNIEWAKNPHTLVARFDSRQLPHFGSFLFRLSIVNGGQIVYSSIAVAEPKNEGKFECRFGLSDQLRARTDNTELEIFGFNGDFPHEGTLCCRWQVWYVRELHFQGHAVGNGSNTVKFDWLENATRTAVSARTKAALTINRGNRGFTSHIGNREADPWVRVNRDFVTYFTQLHPPKSEGQFFPPRGQENDEGRLQFVEWFKALLAKYQQHQVVIFDPYFESAGLGLVLLCAAQGGDYIVFRSLTKTPKTANATSNGSDPMPRSGIDNLVANCENNRQQLQRIKLRIYGLKEGQLHDRYILITGQDKLPVVGFHLSNSFQTAAQSYPLLVTPIPPDVLFKVEQYKFELVQQATNSVGLDDETENPTIRPLFDSMVSPTTLRRYEPLSFLEAPLAGNVLSAWANVPSLRGLSGEPLKEQLAALDLLKDDRLTLPKTANLINFLGPHASNFKNFAETWEVLGEVIAHTPTENHYFRELESECGFLKLLLSFIKTSFDRLHDEDEKELMVIDSWFFSAPIEDLLHSSYHPHQLFHATKYKVLNWSEYYAIKFLWWYSPDDLLAIAEDHMAQVPREPQSSDAVRHSLLSQIVCEISLSTQFGINDRQRERLVSSKNGLLQWMGLNAIEQLLEKDGGLAIVRQLIANFSYPAKVRALGWMVNHAARVPNKTEIYKDLVTTLHETLPAKINADELRYLIDSMRGHMRQLTWAEPWLFRDVIFPLLLDDRANKDDACEIWIQELGGLLRPDRGQQSRLFDLSREGQMTNITAFLFANGDLEQQRTSLELILEILKRQKRILQQPLASTSNWTRWNDALVVSMWIFTFARWSQYYLRQRRMTSHELDELAQSACALALIRTIEEWRASGPPSNPGPLAAFLDQVETLLASCDENQ